MPTVMEQALISAGVPVPSQTERIWRWVKDHPGHTTVEIKAAMKDAVRVANLSSMLKQLEDRKMVESKLAPRRSWKSGPERVKVWSTPSSMPVYEVLPYPKKERKIKAAAVQAIQPVTGPVVQPVQPAPLVAPPPEDATLLAISKMTLPEAHKLYIALGEYFNAR